MNELLAAVLLLSLAAVAYTYVGYPVLIYTCARVFGRRARPRDLDENRAPSVSILIAAYNEEAVIGERIENALACRYPGDWLQIVVASDGSTDRTAEIVRRYEARHGGRVRLIDYPVRRGKAAVLNASIAQLGGEIVVLSDANTFFDAFALQRLVRWFADPAVGAVCGKLVLVDPQSGRNVDSLYWRYESLLKHCEGRLGALLGSNGAIYAIRRDDYVPIAADTIIDDFTIPLLIKLRRGKAIVYDEQAVATEQTPADVKAEFRRRARIGAGGFQSLARLWRLMLPSCGWTSFAFVSHKLLRWCCPAFLVAALAANLLLAVRGPLYAGLLAAQLGFYGAAIAGALVPGRGPAVHILRLCTLFASMNAALAVGFWRWLTGVQRGTWHRTAREPLAEM